ncbi:UbiA family prenyltransferase [Rhizomonospora bruguierae]|uniref:UbiA family prenyltransferase n=1 Tax=Rhizomonospora bruguierae TaxID=1581705 RepID=UPI001BCAB09D|nr:UbiA family prenyltransferase [Micromonospora sp. NBRC 107566]
MRRTLLGLIRATHPEPAVAVPAVTVLLGAAVGIAPAHLVPLGAAMLAAHLAIGWANDWLDAPRDAAVGRTDKPIATGQVSRRAVGVATLLAIVATVLIGPLNGWRSGLTLDISLTSALLYNWPLKATAASVLPYLVSFGLLPAYVVQALPGAPLPPAWMVAAGALLGAGAHFANVLPDLDDDERTGVRGLPHRLGRTGSLIAGAAGLLGATAVLVFGPPGAPSPLGIAGAALAVAVLITGWYLARSAVARGGRPVAIFRAVLILAVIDVVLLLANGSAR